MQTFDTKFKVGNEIIIPCNNTGEKFRSKIIAILIKNEKLCDYPYLCLGNEARGISGRDIDMSKMYPIGVDLDPTNYYYWYSDKEISLYKKKRCSTCSNKKAK